MTVRSACLCSLMFVAASSTMLAKDPAAKAVYCTQSPNGDWTLQRFKPLIVAKGGTVFAEMSFDAAGVREVKVRQFHGDWELAFDYVFDGTGKLSALRGTVTVKTTPPPGTNTDTEPMVFADWLGEADLTPGEDGRIPPHHVLYSREKDRIDKPDDADKYIGRFDEAPIYKTIQSVPCAAMLKQAEKMNATQE